jgi:thiol-disulfide isomerase/thioredoxin
MAILAAAVVVVGVLCVVDLLLSVGVIRRLREHTALLAQLRAAGPAPAELPGPGARVGEFSATTLAGDGVTLATTGGQTLVGFFSPGCAPCKALLPGFVEYAGVAGTPVLAVIVGDGPEVAGLTAALEPVAQVVHEEHGGAVSGAFGASMFPALLVVDANHTVIASGHELAAVRLPVAAGRERG